MMTYTTRRKWLSVVS